jgi:hypothetical protein
MLAWAAIALGGFPLAAMNVFSNSPQAVIGASLYTI